MSSAWSEIKKIHKASTFGAKEGLAFKLFSRPVASFVLYFIQHGRVTPNQITILSLIVGLIGSFWHAWDLTYFGLLVGGALFMIAHMLDALDGQLARHRKAGSVVGMHFDFFIDELKAFALLLSLSVRIYRQAVAGDVPYLLEPIVDRFGTQGLIFTALAGFTGLAMGISCTKFVKMQDWKDAFPPAEPGEGGSKSPVAVAVGLVEKVGKFVIDYPSYILLLCVINHVEVYFLGYSFIVCVYAIRALTQISVRLWRINPYS